VRLVHLGFGAGHVQEVLDLLDALDAARLLLEVRDQLGPLDLAPEDDDAVLGVDVDLTLRDVGIAEDLGLDLAGQRRVIGIRLVLLLQVGRLLDQPPGLGLDVRGRAAEILPAAAEERLPPARAGARAPARGPPPDWGSKK
jgi:hypothetical protein